TFFAASNVEEDEPFHLPPSPPIPPTSQRHLSHSFSTHAPSSQPRQPITLPSISSTHRRLPLQQQTLKFFPKHHLHANERSTLQARKV
ncbi:hypothetical protein BC829DRAFT_407795, partial [Chytridium lagenaria]